MMTEWKQLERGWQEILEAETQGGDVQAAFLRWMANVPTAVDKALRAVYQISDDVPSRLKNAMQYSALAPGKRFRPMLVYIAAMICNRKFTFQELMRRASLVACAVEMVHAYSLIHDDLPAMDNDALRRGRATCHIAFDEGTAILAGDALLTLAFAVLTRFPDPGKAGYFVRFLAAAAGQRGMVGGQMDDMQPGTDVPRVCLLTMLCTGDFDLYEEAFSRDREGLASAREYAHKLRTAEKTRKIAPPRTEDDRRAQLLESMQNRKTGALIAASLLMGALAADATAEQGMRLTRFGQHLGLAFQVTDDMLDVSGSVEVMGKKVQKDTEAGKITWPGVLGMDRCRALVETLSRRAADEVNAPCFGGHERVLKCLMEFMKTREK